MNPRLLLLLPLVVMVVGVAHADENDLNRLKRAMKPAFDGYYDKTEFGVTTSSSCTATGCQVLVFDKKTLLLKRVSIWD